MYRGAVVWDETSEKVHARLALAHRSGAVHLTTAESRLPSTRRAAPYMHAACTPHTRTYERTRVSTYARTWVHWLYSWPWDTVGGRLEWH